MSATLIWMSTIGLAGRPGTEAEPTWSIRQATRPSRLARRSRQASKRSGQVALQAMTRRGSGARGCERAPSWNPVELGWGYAEAGCLCCGVQAPVPGGDDKFRVAGGQCAGEVDGVRAPERVHAG